MFKQLKLMAGLAIAATLVACGGGEESGGTSPIYLPTFYYGSIAINQTNGAAGITANYQSQSSANSNALKTCGAGCITVLEFENNECGALASSGLSFGWAKNSNKGRAENAAISQCIANNGKACKVDLSECNG
jgi:hypothetical protein